MTSMTSLAPVAPVTSVSPATARNGAVSALQASVPSLALQGSVSANSFAGLLAASGRPASAAPAAAPAPSPAPATPTAPPAAQRPLTTQAGTPVRRAVDQAGPRQSDHLSQAAAAEPTHSVAGQSSAEAADDADGVDAPDAAAAKTAGDDDAAEATGTADDRATPTHRTRKNASAVAGDAQPAATAAAGVPPAGDVAPPGTSHGVDAPTATDDATAAAVGRPADRRSSHGVVGPDTTDAGASTATSPTAAAAVGGGAAALQADPHAVAAHALASDVVAAAQATGDAASAAASTSAVASLADSGDTLPTGAAGAASAASAIDLRGAVPDMTAATSVTVATPTDAPDFREALGAQVSLLVKDGVQTAELHLNPADMGPISVHIAMDGAQAKIDFAAESADTRRLIETGLPELASALRDAGFTLSGGGVSDHRQGRSGGDAEAGSQSTRRVDVAADTATVRRTVSAASIGRSGSGGLDLYA